MACSLCLNIEYQLHNIVMGTIWIGEYIIVIAYVNQYCMDTFACLE
jgi:hypothetical protein